jgi:2-polyprenyl-3-methyl-5-hydroxy-6-metoxy-1,4-benzoquinol methylase
MAGSNPENRGWVLERVLELNPRTIVDVGAGAGTYSQLLRPLLPDTIFTAIEIYPKNISQYNLNSLYDHVLCMDVRDVSTFGKETDLVIFGDVLEHMSRDDAMFVWNLARRDAKYGIISMPIIHYPQGEIDGNIHETHVVDDWNNLKIFESFRDIKECRLGDVTGAYLAKFRGENA